jgi:hypothetical protein
MNGGIVGVSAKSLYDPDVATAFNAGLFNIFAKPVVAFQSDCTFSYTNTAPVLLFTDVTPASVI